MSTTDSSRYTDPDPHWPGGPDDVGTSPSLFVGHLLTRPAPYRRTSGPDPPSVADRPTGHPTFQNLYVIVFSTTPDRVPDGTCPTQGLGRRHSDPLLLFPYPGPDNILVVLLKSSYRIRKRPNSSVAPHRARPVLWSTHDLTGDTLLSSPTGQKPRMYPPTYVIPDTYRGTGDYWDTTAGHTGT